MANDRVRDAEEAREPGDKLVSFAAALKSGRACRPCNRMCPESPKATTSHRAMIDEAVAAANAR
jgi:hypothetical protein